MLFTSPKNQLESDLKTKLNGKRFYKTNSFKYFWIQIDEGLAWKQQINHVAIKLNKGNAMLSKLRHILHKRSQPLMQYLNPIYSMLHSFGHKTLIQSKDFTYNRKKPSGSFLRVKIPIAGFYLKTPKFASPLIRLPLKTAFSFANISRGYWHLSSIAGSNFPLNITLTVPDGQILVTSKYPYTELKPMVNIQ